MIAEWKQGRHSNEKGRCKVFGSCPTSLSLRRVLLLSLLFPCREVGYMGVLETWIPSFPLCWKSIPPNTHTSHSCWLSHSLHRWQLSLSQKMLMLLARAGLWVPTVSLPKCLERITELRGTESQEICGGFSSQESRLWRQAAAQPVPRWVPCVICKAEFLIQERPPCHYNF